ncbi:MAG: VCBS repeat-containing protein [Planctomycetes bacterium]|nr:VCBS repeat-containing protein [Planctomycetota bacterium]
MRLLRRRRKTALAVGAALVLAAVALAQLLRQREARYEAGERTEGIVDTLAVDVPADHPRVVFSEVARRAGLVFRHFPGERRNLLTEDMGSGVALGDVDGDGWVDAFLVNLAAQGADDEANRSRLFLGGPEGFRDVTATSGIDLVALGNGAAFVDVDGDADLDLFVTSYPRCRLYRNDGGARFSDVSEAAGVAAFEGFWTGIGAADMDRDGDVDLYVCDYVRYDASVGAAGESGSQYGRVLPAQLNPSAFEPAANLLLENRGDGTFRDVAAERGVADAQGRGLGVTFCDVDGDGAADLYVANDVSDNALFLGDGAGGFRDVTAQALVGDYRGAMGLAAADYDGDRDVDLFITHWIAQENALYSQKPRAAGDPGPPLFFDDADRVGLGHTALDRVGWGTRFFDYDNDGWLDLFVVNGHTIPLEARPRELEPMRPQLFWHATDPRHYFHEVGAVSGDFWREPWVARGAATFDYDLDGDEDLVVVRHGGAAALLRNDGGDARPALRVRLRQPSGDRFALGARVELVTSAGARLDWVGTQGSYLSQHAVGELAFGLGDARLVDELRVTWPDGTTERAGPFLTRSIVTWERGSAPRVEAYPGRATRDVERPARVEDERRFFETRKRGTEARLAGDLRAASAAYLEALALWPGHGDCLYYLGNCEAHLGREALALQAFERRAHYEPQSSQAWMQIGMLRLPGGDPTLDDLASARAAFERCHELNGEESRPQVMLGVVAMLADELDVAAAHLADAARLNPRSVEARWFAGRVAWLAGRRDDAAAWLAEARALAGERDAGASKSNEGDTKSGAALTADEGVPLAPALTRWRDLGARVGDPAEEYGG